jgi:aminoglycoside N3'-acetyltransferase
MVHTSLQNIKLNDFQPEDLIYFLKMVIGTEGTLLMPVFGKSNLTPFYSQSQPDKFNSFFGDDLITEVFQQMPDTIIGFNSKYTFAAWGKLANFITETNSNTESSLNRVSLSY